MKLKKMWARRRIRTPDGFDPIPPPLAFRRAKSGAINLSATRTC